MISSVKLDRHIAAVKHDGSGMDIKHSQDAREMLGGHARPTCCITSIPYKIAISLAFTSRVSTGLF